MAALHVQLKRIVAQKFEDVDLDTKSSTGTLPTSVTMALKKAMTSGWADQVRSLSKCAFSHVR